MHSSMRSNRRQTVCAILLLLLGLQLHARSRANMIGDDMDQQQQHAEHHHTSRSSSLHSDQQRRLFSNAKCTPAAEIARAAYQLCSGLPIEAALQSARLLPESARAVGQLLAGLGFSHALDLQLLGGGEEAAELMEQLAEQEVSIADRSKIRLLVGDRDHFARLQPMTTASAAASAAKRLLLTTVHADDPSGDARPSSSQGAEEVESVRFSRSRRRLQDAANAQQDSQISPDTIAIVLSVLIGAAGCE
eukprot:SAG31_NODE_65_length_28565_cov_8.402914_13_plen_248_part_00